MSMLEKLTEGIQARDLSKESKALINKWEKTGLLEGLKDDHAKNGMSRLLENQAMQVLKEASSMQTGDVEGFASVAFPIVRRVFGSLIANDLVSVQPMSLPSGLIFYLDFTYTDTKKNAGAVAAQSIYGGGKVGHEITGGIDLIGQDPTNDLWAQEKGMYNLNQGYASPTASADVVLTFRAARSGSGTWDTSRGDAAYRNLGDRLVQYDIDVSGSVVAIYTAPKSSFSNLNEKNLMAIHTVSSGTMGPLALVRRLSDYDILTGSTSTQLMFVFASYNSGSIDSSTDIGVTDDNDGATVAFTYPVNDGLTTGGGLGSIVGTTPWGLEGSPDLLAGQSGLNVDIPEIDIKVDSFSVTAKSKKLKARWTPELGQDLNAYHNLDAEVELTSVLSEQIGLEIDQEILVDLIKGASAGTYYWSRRPGKFVNRTTGADITANGSNLPDFYGNVSEWYETLVETMNDLAAVMHRKNLRGGANFVVCSPEVASILEMTAGFRAAVTVGEDKGSIGAQNKGTISNKWDLYVDPYFTRNLILMGRKGSSFLEAGYVYAPYVPLQMSPTIFGVEDFTPRKACMTRYAKAMTKADFYGLVVVTDLLG